jgi:hypothetical protein
VFPCRGRKTKHQRIRSSQLLKEMATFNGFGLMLRIQPAVLRSGTLYCILYWLFLSSRNMVSEVKNPPLTGYLAVHHSCLVLYFKSVTCSLLTCALPQHSVIDSVFSLDSSEF